MWHNEGKIIGRYNDTLHWANVSLQELTGKLLSKGVDFCWLMPTENLILMEPQ